MHHKNLHGGHTQLIIAGQVQIAGGHCDTEATRDDGGEERIFPSISIAGPQLIQRLSTGLRHANQNKRRSDHSEDCESKVNPKFLNHRDDDRKEQGDDESTAPV